jgi:nicotinate-nucleotide--dimethylbenzimidazole phosphoribosyltransferase
MLRQPGTASASLADLDIPPLDESAAALARGRQDTLTKPQGSLGVLEELSVRLAAMTGRIDPPLDRAVVFTLAGDHGVAEEGVSAYPQEVTAQMVLNFLRGGAAVNVLARAVGARVVVADLGVAADLPADPQLRGVKVRHGTANLTRVPAMSLAEAEQAIQSGRVLVAAEAPLDVVLLGDMGIANTTASACLICHFTGIPPAQVVGRGTGIDDAGLARKVEAVNRALHVNREASRFPLGALAALGGLEIAGLVGVILEAAQRRIPVVVDGFISTAAALTAVSLAPGCAGYLVAAHRSQELGHAVALAALGLRPILDLDLRLGEGSGALLALPILRASVRILTEMATFGEAGVSTREEGGGGPTRESHEVVGASRE